MKQTVGSKKFNCNQNIERLNNYEFHIVINFSLCKYVKRLNKFMILNMIGGYYLQRFNRGKVSGKIHGLTTFSVIPCSQLLSKG